MPSASTRVIAPPTIEQRSGVAVSGHELVITAVIGGLLGTAVGIAFAYLTTRALSEWDVSFSVPPGQLGLIAVISVVVGVVGAIAPARRGARIDVLSSIRYE